MWEFEGYQEQRVQFYVSHRSKYFLVFFVNPYYEIFQIAPKVPKILEGAGDEPGLENKQFRAAFYTASVSQGWVFLYAGT